MVKSLKKNQAEKTEEWQRFELALDAVLKSPPRPKVKAKKVKVKEKRKKD